jgi:hypothetical protein
VGGTSGGAIDAIGTRWWPSVVRHDIIKISTHGSVINTCTTILNNPLDIKELYKWVNMGSAQRGTMEYLEMVDLHITTENNTMVGYINHQLTWALVDSAILQCVHS